MSGSSPEHESRKWEPAQSAAPDPAQPTQNVRPQARGHQRDGPTHAGERAAHYLRHAHSCRRISYNGTNPALLASGAIRACRRACGVQDDRRRRKSALMPGTRSARSPVTVMPCSRAAAQGKPRLPAAVLDRRVSAGDLAVQQDQPRRSLVRSQYRPPRSRAGSRDRRWSPGPTRRAHRRSIRRGVA